MHKKVCVYYRLRLQSSSCGRGLNPSFCIVISNTFVSIQLKYASPIIIVQNEQVGIIKITF